MRWQKSNSSPAKVILSQNYSTTFEKLPALMISRFNTPLETERETGSGGTILADYESDLESFSPECLVPVIIQQPGGAPSQHDPNEALDQISADYLIQDAPPDEDEATRTARRARNPHKEERRVHAAEHARIPPSNLNYEFNNVTNHVFRTPIAAMTEVTL